MRRQPYPSCHGPILSGPSRKPYHSRTNQNLTLRTNPLRTEDLADFIACYNPANRHQRRETERFHSFSYEELLKRDKLSLDLFWLHDASLEDADGLPEPDVLARSIVEDLQTALAQFAAIASDLGDDAEVLDAMDDALVE